MPSISGSAVVNLSVSASGSTGPANTISLSLPAGQAAVTNYPFQFARPFLQGAIAHAPQVLVNGSPITTQADVKCRYPDGSVKHAVLACVVPSIPQGISVTISFVDSTTLDNTPLSSTQMLGTGYNFDAALTVTGTGSGATPQTISARSMIGPGFYSLWTSGQVAQTIELADDTTARSFDVGFGDGFHPLRPRFYATFWPAINAVKVRVVVENDLTSELEDVEYTASISLGATSPIGVYSADLSGTQATHPKKHWAMTAWTKSFWYGYTEPQVNIDHNLAYLASTRFLPNYDMTLAVTAMLPSLPVGDIYDGQWDHFLVQNAMGVVGEHPEIGPYPQWHVQALYPPGDYNMRALMLAATDQAGSFPGHLRESVSGKRLSIADVAGSSSGFGHTLSITDRTSISILSGLGYSGTRVNDRVVVVGAIAAPPLAQPWSFEGAHQPSFFYIPYLITGDPWYLQEMYLWAGFSAGLYNGAAATAAYGRGPTGAEGGINDQLRGAGWVLRNRAETAFIAPDADPEKAYFTYLTNEAGQRWEGSLGITGTPYDGTPEKNWGALRGNYYSQTGGPEAGKPPPLGNWESNGSPNGKDATIVDNVAADIYATRSDGAPAAGTFTSPWMEWYKDYGIARTAQLGFAFGPLRIASSAFVTSMILDSGYPQLIGMYQMPVEGNALPLGASSVTPQPPLTAPPGGWLSTWSALEATITPAFLTGVNWPASGNGGAGDLLQYFATNLTSDGRPIWLMGALAMMVDAGDPRAAAAWAWFFANVYQVIPLAQLQVNPRWAILPRTDNNVLPPIPTSIP